MPRCFANRDLANRSFAMWRLLKDYWVFLRRDKKWWLAPLLIVLLLLGLLLVFSSSSVLAPFMYPFM